jgi:hypothetical protein
MCSDPDGHVGDSEYRLPDWFAAALMSQLRPTGRIVVPGAESSSGAFVRALQGTAEVSGCKAISADDFLSWAGRVDWVITNPPWNNFRKFLVHALEIADHVAMLVTVNHWWTQRRVADVKDAAFGYDRLILCDWPPECASNGFQLGLMVVSRGHTGPLAIEWLRTTHNTRPQFGQPEGRFVPRRRRPNDPSQGEFVVEGVGRGVRHERPPVPDRP